MAPEQADRGVSVVQAELGAGSRTRLQLKTALNSAGVPTAGQALVHVLFLATLRGLYVLGPVVGKEQALVLVKHWLPPAPEVDRDVALGERGPGATSPGTGRRPPGISRTGPASRSTQRAEGWLGYNSSGTSWSTCPGARCRRPGCSGPSTSCSWLAVARVGA